MKHITAKITDNKKFIKKKALVFVLIVLLLFSTVFVWADYTNETPYLGFPGSITLQLSGLDESGDLIYCGIDFAIFQDEDDDGIFQPMDGKVKRFLTTSTNITINLGDSSDYKKGKLYKMALRTLYVPTGVNDNHLIVIADQDNGKDGWVLIPNSVFKLSYFPQDQSAFIEHTVRWNENRAAYNAQALIDGSFALVRSADTFWSGEKFILNIETLEPLPAIRVSINDEEYVTLLTSYIPTTSGGAIYTGELWERSMFNKWGNDVPETITFYIDAVSAEGEILETIEIPITVDNREPYFNIRCKY